MGLTLLEADPTPKAEGGKALESEIQLLRDLVTWTFGVSSQSVTVSYSIVYYIV